MQNRGHACPLFSVWRKTAMTEFYLIRHGKTVFNREGRFQGCRKDSPLLEQSIADARRAGEYLKGTRFDAFYTSPMPRSQETGRAVLYGMGLEDADVTVVNDMREFDFGRWDGDLVSSHRGSAEFETFFHDPDNFSSAEMQGEDYRQFVSRIQGAAGTIFRQHPDGRVLVFAHALVNTFLVKSLLGEDFSTIRREGLVSNTSLCILNTNDFQKFQLEMWDNTDYLK